MGRVTCLTVASQAQNCRFRSQPTHYQLAHLCIHGSETAALDAAPWYFLYHSRFFSSSVFGFSWSIDTFTLRVCCSADFAATAPGARLDAAPWYFGSNLTPRLSFLHVQTRGNRTPETSRAARIQFPKDAIQGRENGVVRVAYEWTQMPIAHGTAALKNHCGRNMKMMSTVIRAALFMPSWWRGSFVNLPNFLSNHVDHRSNCTHSRVGSEGSTAVWLGCARWNRAQRSTGVRQPARWRCKKI